MYPVTDSKIKACLGIVEKSKIPNNRVIFINESKAQNLAGKCWGHIVWNMLKVIDVLNCCEKSKEVSDAFEYPSEEHQGLPAHMYSMLNLEK